MSMLVVQERHLWLSLVEMRDTDNDWFLNAPVSQTGLFSDAVENLAQQFSAAREQTEAVQPSARQAAAASTHPSTGRSAPACSSPRAAPCVHPLPRRIRSSLQQVAP